jgi:hypothetical protein
LTVAEEGKVKRDFLDDRAGRHLVTLLERLANRGVTREMPIEDAFLAISTHAWGTLEVNANAALDKLNRSRRPEAKVAPVRPAELVSWWAQHLYYGMQVTNRERAHENLTVLLGARAAHQPGGGKANSLLSLKRFTELEGCVSPYNPGVVPAFNRVAVDEATNAFVCKLLEESATLFSTADGAYTLDDDNMGTRANDLNTPSVKSRKRRPNGSNYNVVADVFFHLVVAAWYVIGTPWLPERRVVLRARRTARLV